MSKYQGESFYFHDYETFGLDPKKSRASQFAGIRTDKDLNILPEGENDFLNIYCEITPDHLPSPDACLVTGHTPQRITKMRKEENALEWKDKTVLNEYEFARRINKILSKSKTCGIGYNSISFDDEFTRNILFRSLLDPYQREWSAGCSRSDGINFIRFAYLVDQKCLNFPDKVFKESEEAIFYHDGRPVKSFKLEDLSKANGIEHASAHDAMSDVYALIGVLKKLKENRPDIFDYIYNLRTKKNVLNLLDSSSDSSLLHVSSYYGTKNNSMSVIQILSVGKDNPSERIFVDLQGNIDSLINLSAEEIKEHLYLKKDELESRGLERPPLNKFAINKCPVISKLGWIKDNSKSLGLNGNKIRENKTKLMQNIDLIKSKLDIIYESKEFPPSVDPDLSIYDEFISNHDKEIMKGIHIEILRGEFIGQNYPFESERIKQVYDRFKLRNFAYKLDVHEQTEWKKFCRERITGTRYDDVNQEPSICKSFGEHTLDTFLERLSELKKVHINDKEKIQILIELYQYAKGLCPEHPAFDVAKKKAVNKP
jgi:exodeoxyribonuclease-1